MLLTSDVLECEKVKPCQVLSRVTDLIKVMDEKYYKAKVANLKKQAIEMVKVELNIESIFYTLDFGYIILSELLELDEEGTGDGQ